jgi:hypothetical protein
MTQKTDRTATIEGRTSHRYIAGIALWASQSGYPVASKSDLVDLAFETLYNYLTTKSQLTPIETTEEALDLLGQLNISGLNRQNKGRATLLAKLQSESNIAELTESIKRTTPIIPTPDTMRRMLESGQLDNLEEE